MIQLPNQKTWTQNNKSSVLGSLQGSFNLDLQTNLGKVRGTRMIQTTTQATNADMSSAPMAFRRWNGYIWTIAGTKVHRTSPAGTYYPRVPFILDTSTSSPTVIGVDSDMETFNNFIYVTGSEFGAGTLRKGDSSSWSTNGTALGAGFHGLATFGDRLYIVAASTRAVYSMNTSDSIATSGQYTLSLTNHDGAAGITFIRASSDRIWIGLGASTSSRRGLIYEWDGSSNQATRSYRLEANTPKACVIKDDIPYVMDSNGRLLVWNGGTFTEIARLPVNNKILKGLLGSGLGGWIHPNGMSVIDGKVNILINNVLQNSGSPIEEFCPSGIWEYDPEVGLYHKHSLSYTPVGTTTITDWGQNRLSEVGALTEMKTEDTDATANGTFLAGAKVFLTQSTTDCGVFINDTKDTTQKFAYFVTPELEAEGISDTFQKVFINIRKHLNSTDKAIVKYRISKQEPTEMTITWTSTTTFTTTDVNMANYAVGDEVEITRGKGGGMCSHITVIALATGTYTVTVDETHTGATSGTASARLQKWIKLGSITDQVKTFEQFPVGVNANWIQYKVCFLWTGANEFERLTSVNTPSQKAV